LTRESTQRWTSSRVIVRVSLLRPGHRRRDKAQGRSSDARYPGGSSGTIPRTLRGPFPGSGPSASAGRERPPGCSCPGTAFRLASSTSPVPLHLVCNPRTHRSAYPRRLRLTMYRPFCSLNPGEVTHFRHQRLFPGEAAPQFSANKHSFLESRLRAVWGRSSAGEQRFFKPWVVGSIPTALTIRGFSPETCLQFGGVRRVERDAERGVPWVGGRSRSASKSRLGLLLILVAIVVAGALGLILERLTTPPMFA
jgi:hypothetical protein